MTGPTSDGTCPACGALWMRGSCGAGCPAPIAAVDVLAVMRHAVSAMHGAADDGADTRRYADALHEAREAVARLIDAAGQAQDPNRDDFVLGRPDVSGLAESERDAFLRGWDAASAAVFGTGLRAALACVRGGA